MDDIKILVYYGKGSGKTSAAVGAALRYVCRGDTAYMVQFMKGLTDYAYLERLEPELKVFRFDGSHEKYDELSEPEKQDEKKNINNALQFARKVLATGECDLLILDEILYVIEEHLVAEEEILELLKLQKSSGIRVILTGQKLSPGIAACADSVVELVPRHAQG